MEANKNKYVLLVCVVGIREINIINTIMYKQQKGIKFFCIHCPAFYSLNKPMSDLDKHFAPNA